MRNGTHYRTVLLLMGVVVVGLVVGEFVLRALFPHFLEGPEQYTSDGLRKKRLSTFLAELSSAPPEFIVIGDSFVATGVGRGGWVQELRASSGRAISAYGQPGAAPAQYFSVYDRIRQVNPDVPVLILLYVGNDLVDETIFQSVAPRFEHYMEVRREVFSDPRAEPFFPCFAGAGRIERSSLARNLASVRLMIMATQRGIRRVLARADSEAHPLEDIFFERCHQPPGSVLVGNRNFFFDLHNYLVDTDVGSNKESESRITAYLAERSDDENLAVTVLLDREDVCRGFHELVIKSGENLVPAFADAGVRVIDPNAALADGCVSENLYLADRHWNFKGHQLFASIIEREWIQFKADR